MRKFISISQPSITEKEITYVMDAVSSGWVSSLGKYIDLFEKKFAEFCGTKYALSTSNGTVALHLALVALGIGEGDEVIVPDFTFIATANAVKYTGAKVVTVDIDEKTLCIDPRRIEEAITKNTKAIIPVHIYGHPANMDEILKIARKYNLYVVEDAAEAHGAEIKGKKVGTFGDCAIFSFYGNKIMTTGEGGIITTNNKDLYERMLFLRDHAMDRKKRYWHTEIGFNYRMTNLQAALGLAQLERIEELLERKREIFEWYEKALKDVEKIELNYEAEWAKNVFWMVCIEIEDCTEAKRDKLIAKLKEKGIDSRPYFYPISDMPMYKNKINNTPIVHKIYKRGFCVPSYFDLKKEDVLWICDNLKRILKDNKY